MNPIRILFATLAALGSSSLGIAATDAVNPRPNVLMIAIDDLNDYVSTSRNYPGVKTPNFDRLAKRSVNFTRAFCAAPLCNPSRAAVDTGLAPNETGIYELSDEIRRSAPALACVSLVEQFKRHGYDTYLTGKYLHAGPANWWPEKRMNAMWTEKKAPFSDHGPKSSQPNNVMGPGVFAFGPAEGGLAAMPDVAILKNTQGWLAAKHDRPFFIVNGISKPHVAYVVPQEFFDLYPLDSIVLPEPPGDDYADIPAIVKEKVVRKQDLEHFANIRKTKDGWKEVMQAYLASVSFCDWVVGQILDALDASPYAKNTVVVLWSDHGYHIGEKEKMHKRALWTQSSHVPFLLSVPGLATAGRACPAPVSLMDIFPTLNDVCRLDQKVPQKLAGHSLAPLLKDAAQAWPYVAVTTHETHNAAVSDARYHYIRYLDGSAELYDHQSDPREFTNVAQVPAMQPVIARLAASLPAQWAPSVGAMQGRKGGGAEEK